MLDRTDISATPLNAASLSEIQLLSVATAVPSLRYSQDEALTRARGMFPELVHLESLFENTGIATRHSCVPLEWFHQPHGWTDRNATFERCALELLEQAARTAMADANLIAGDIGAIITVSTTGLAVPSMDAELLHRLGLELNTERLPIFGLGCAGGVSGIARAARMAATLDGKAVLMLCVELCGLNFRKGGQNEKLNFVSTALFGDGAAAVIIRAGEPGSGAASRAVVEATGEHNWPDTANIMGWSIEDDGFGVVMSTQIPKFARNELRGAVDRFLSNLDLDINDLDGIIAHPGGRKVLEAMSTALERPRDDFVHSWDVLRDHGNMSSPTVLFVLHRTISSAPKGRHLMIAFGPGFTVSFALLNFSSGRS